MTPRTAKGGHFDTEFKKIEMPSIKVFLAFGTFLWLRTIQIQ